MYLFWVLSNVKRPPSPRSMQVSVRWAPKQMEDPSKVPERKLTNQHTKQKLSSACGYVLGATWNGVKPGSPIP